MRTDVSRYFAFSIVISNANTRLVQASETLKPLTISELLLVHEESMMTQ